MALVLALCGRGDCATDDGQAPTPPLGWLSWLGFGCATNCSSTTPWRCISAAMVHRQADALVSSGLAAAGFRHIILDDCWQAESRDPATGELRPDPVRFPNGIRPLADYVHSRGLKMGIYAAMGRRTCAGFPGSLEHVELDARTFVSWGVDYLKMDVCDSPLSDVLQPKFEELGIHLNKTGRRVLLSCEWPAILLSRLVVPDWGAVRRTCHTWRPWFDAQAAWPSTLGTVDFWGLNLFNFTEYGGRGSWSDPDQLALGLGGLTADEEAAQLALWSVMAAPLLLSVDVASLPLPKLALLLHSDVLPINQAVGAPPGRQHIFHNEWQTWTRSLRQGVTAVVVLNSYSAQQGGRTLRITLPLRALIPKGDVVGSRYNLREVFSKAWLKRGMSLDQPVVASLRPSQALFFVAMAVDSDVL